MQVRNLCLWIPQRHIFLRFQKHGPDDGNSGGAAVMNVTKLRGLGERVVVATISLCFGLRAVPRSHRHGGESAAVNL